VFLLLRLPGIWQKTGFERSAQGGSGSTPAGLSLVLCGLLTLTTPVWAAPTHIFNGYNTANVLLWPLILAGSVMSVAGAAILRAAGTVRRVEAAPLITQAGETHN
jgi:hypothetical protein